VSEALRSPRIRSTCRPTKPPKQLFRAIGKLRKDARDEIDRLIRFLDETDNHMELEDSIDDNPQGDQGDDEPSLGSLSAMMDQSRWATAGDGGIDAEEEHDGREPEPLEADLGSLDQVVDQRRTMLESSLPWSVADGEVGAT
jgi:hypothetical protein